MGSVGSWPSGAEESSTCCPLLEVSVWSAQTSFFSEEACRRCCRNLRVIDGVLIGGFFSPGSGYRSLHRGMVLQALSSACSVALCDVDFR